jgi:hypothetical protein
MSTEVVHQGAAVAAALGVVVMLLPREVTASVRLSDTPRRLAGLGLLLAAWIAMAATLVPSGLQDRLSRPAWAGAAVVGIIVGLVVAALLGRVLARRPWVWLLLLGLALPVRIPISVGGTDANLLVPLYGVIVLGLFTWFWLARAGERVWRGTPLDLPLLLFVGFTLTSLCWSSDITEAATKITFFWIPFLLLYVLAAQLWRRGRALPVLGITTMAMAVPVALLAVGEYATRQVLWNHRLEQANVYSRFFRVNSIFYDPNILGRYLVVAMLIGVAIAWLKRADGRVLVAVAAAEIMYAAGLVVTYSRSSALMLMIGLFIMSLRLFRPRRVILIAVIIGLVGAVGAVAGSHQVRDALTSTARLSKVSEGRFDLINGGIDMWQQHPVAGGGLGSFATNYTDMLSAGELRKTRVVISHNAPVTILSEGGAIGFAFFAWLCVVAVLVGIRATRDRDEDVGVPGAMMLAALVGIFVHALLYSALAEDPYTWVLAAGLVVLATAPHGEPLPEPGTAEAP